MESTLIESGILMQVAIVELPFGFVSSDYVGGAGGTCVIRGCVPKKLLVYAYVVCLEKERIDGNFVIVLRKI